MCQHDSVVLERRWYEPPTTTTSDVGTPSAPIASASPPAALRVFIFATRTLLSTKSEPPTSLMIDCGDCAPSSCVSPTNWQSARLIAMVCGLLMNPCSDADGVHVEVGESMRVDGPSASHADAVAVRVDDSVRKQGLTKHRWGDRVKIYSSVVHSNRLVCGDTNMESSCRC